MSGFIGSALGAVGNVSSAISGVLNMIPCSWRGIPIQIYNYAITNAPQVRVHMGAYWRYPQVEDLGTAPCIIRISGFIDPSFGLFERPLLEAMVIAKGSGLLTIPSKGAIYAHCLSCTFREDISNIVDVDLEFVQTKSPLGLLGDLISGSLPDSIGDAIAGAENDVLGDLSGGLDKLTSSVGSLF